MATVMWGIPKAAVAMLEKQGTKLDNTIVTDIEYGTKCNVQRVFVEPVSSQDPILRAHPGEPDTVAE